MQDLTPVGLSKDGRRLVLVSSSGEEYAVTIDHRLRTALRGDTARLGQLEMKMESALRPRDIQTRIRAGESPEAVAAAAQTTVEAIMPYAAPVLAERAHVAQSAQASSVRRKQSEAPTGHRTLADAAAAHFSGTGIRVDDIEWDAWRRDDGRWTLVANFAAGSAPQQAQFTFDARGRYVMADNDEARLLTGELSAPERGSAPTRQGRSGSTGRRLSAVPNDDELPLGDGLGDGLGDEIGDDAIELVRETPGATPEAGQEETTDLTDAATPLREEPAAEAGDETTDETAEAQAQAQPQEQAQDQAQDQGDSGSDAAARRRKKGRSSVPSWDEIMFGGGKPD